MSANRGVRGHRRQVEADHHLLVGGVAEAFRRVAQGDAWHLAESSHATTARANERWSREPRAKRYRAGSGCLLFVGLWPLGAAPRRRCAPVGPRTPLTSL